LSTDGQENGRPAFLLYLIENKFVFDVLVFHFSASSASLDCLLIAKILFFPSVVRMMVYSLECLLYALEHVVRHK